MPQLVELLDVLVNLSQQPDPHLGVLGGGAEMGVLAEPGGEGLHDAGDGGAQGEEDLWVLGVADGLGEGDAELGDEACREMVGGRGEGREKRLEVAPVLVQVANSVVHEVLVADARAAVVHENVGADVVDREGIVLLEGAEGVFCEARWVSMGGGGVGGDGGLPFSYMKRMQ